MSHQEIDHALDNCVYGRSVKFLYVSPERLLTELFQVRVAKMSVGLLNAYLFASLRQVREQCLGWQYDYNHLRPHQALNLLTPIEFWQAA